MRIISAFRVMSAVPDVNNEEEPPTKRNYPSNMAPLREFPAMFFFNLNGPIFRKSEFKKEIRNLAAGSQGAVKLMSNDFHE